MLATRFLCRLLMPWMEKPCSRVRVKLSGELTIIQNCDARPPPPEPEPPPDPPPLRPLPPRRRRLPPGVEAAGDSSAGALSAVPEASSISEAHTIGANRFSPAVTATGRVFSGGASGPAQRGVLAEEGAEGWVEAGGT